MNKPLYRLFILAFTFLFSLFAEASEDANTLLDTRSELQSSNVPTYQSQKRIEAVVKIPGPKQLNLSKEDKYAKSFQRAKIKLLRNQQLKDAKESNEACQDARHEEMTRPLPMNSSDDY